MTIYTHTGLSAPTNASDTTFRKWASLVDAMILACGWVQTADTGQSDPATATVPGTNTTAAGYRVYSLNDALAGVAPVLLKYEWGRGGSTTAPAAWFTVGTGSDGAGAITGVLQPRIQTGTGTTVSVTEYWSYASSDGSSLSIVMWPDIASNLVPAWALRVERSRTLAGEPTADALAITMSAANVSRTIAYSGTPGSVGDALGSNLPCALPATVNGTNSASFTVSLSQDGTTAPVFPVVYSAPGVVPWVSANAVALATGDAGASSLVIANTHGVDRIFRAFTSATHAGRDVMNTAGSRAALAAMLWAEV